MSRTWFLLILILLPVLWTQPAIAGEAVWNPGGDMAAYIDFIVPDDEYLDTKTLFFYEEEMGYRYRGTYFPLGAHLYEINIGYIAADELTIVEWTDDRTVLVEASLSWDESPVTALYEVSITGRTGLIGIENLAGDGREMLPQNVPDEWDFLEESMAIDRFLYDLCEGDLPVDEDYMPLTIEGSYSRNDLLKRDWDCDELMPIRYVMPDTLHEDALFVSGLWSTKFVFGFVDSHPAMLWFSDADI